MSEDLPFRAYSSISVHFSLSKPIPQFKEMRGPILYTGMARRSH